LGSLFFTVRKITQHPQYNTKTYHNDISILTLNGLADFSCSIWPICLPDPGDDYTGKTATVAGTSNKRYIFILLLIFAGYS
jgi:hypothetical protein